MGLIQKVNNNKNGSRLDIYDDCIELINETMSDDDDETIFFDDDDR